MRKILIFLLVVPLIGACATKSPEDYVDDKLLYEHAMKLYKGRSFGDSIPFFESLRHRFPQSPYATESTLKVADAYYEKDDFLEAEVSYQKFRSLFPTNSKIPYVVSRLGMTHVQQVPRGTGRDQLHCKKALKYFDELDVRWPSSKEAKEAKPHVQKCKRKMAEQELYVADFYLKQNEYRAALVRLHELRNHPDFPDLRAQAAYKLGYAYYKLKEPTNAKPALKSVLAEKAAGKYKAKAERLLSKLEDK